MKATIASIVLSAATCLVACGGGGGGGAIQSSAQVSAAPSPSTASASEIGSGPNVAVTAQPLVQTPTQRPAFLGAFFRAEGNPPFGVFSATSVDIAPSPYPSPGGPLLGSTGYCTAVAANGFSIETGYLVDQTKLNNLVSLGVKWVRMSAPQFSDDLSHIFGAGSYSFADLDSAECSTLALHSIVPVIELDAGPVQYNVTPGTFSPATAATYASASDFGQWCGVVASHEKAAFPAVYRYSLPGNEVNTAQTLFPGGNAQIAAYSEACYRAIKTANPAAFVYGFELNMDGTANAPGFVSSMAALGCKFGTCYDGISIHLSLRYPLLPVSTPCYPSPGGDYTVQCITAIQSAAQASVHILISESVITVPAAVPDEATKALAIVAEFNAFAGSTSVDGVNYANIDECALYPVGVFSGGCLINTSGEELPAFEALQQLALGSYQ